jgi:hypothetical protein
MDIINIVSALTGIAGVIFGVYAVIRSRQLSRPTLILHAGLIKEKDYIPKNFRKTPKRTLIFGTKPLVKNHSVLCCPYRLENPTKLPVTNVTLQLQYPSKYLMDEAIFLDETKEVAMAVTGTVSPNRSVLPYGDVVLVRYEFSLIRPGETLILQDFISMKKIGFKDFNDKNIAEVDIARMYQRLSNIDGFIGSCVIHASVRSSSCNPIANEILILSFATTSMSELLDKCKEAARKAWDGKRLKRGLYFRLFGRQKKLPGVELCELVIQSSENFPSSMKIASKSLLEAERTLIHFSMPPWGLYGESFDLHEHFLDIQIKEENNPLA